MLMNSFFERVERDGKNLEPHFQPRSADLMLVACLQAVWEGPDGERFPCFTAVTDDPPPEVEAAGHNRCPIALRPENVSAWLTAEGRSESALQALLSDRQQQFYEHEVMAE
jgi:putative SOS response-associated peptidase YedK